MEKSSEVENPDVQNEEAGENTEEGLSLRDALEVAIEATSDEVPEQREEPKAVEPAEPPLEPPSEFTADEKEDFKQLTRKQQEAQLRLHKSRMSRLSEIKQAAEEYKYLQKYAESIAPYLKARGHKEPGDVSVQKAVAHYLNCLEDPIKATIATLKASGREVPAILEQAAKPVAIDPLEEKLSPLKSELDAIKSERAQEQRRQAATALQSVWSSFESAKSASGVARFPDIQPDKGETGNRLAAQIGSLVSGQTPVSQQWIGMTKERIPGATFETLLVEAYRYLGGRVDDSTTTGTQQNPQKHLARSNRAASSVPGRGAGLGSSRGERKFKSYREAAEAALKELNDG